MISLANSNRVEYYNDCNYLLCNLYNQFLLIIEFIPRASEHEITVKAIFLIFKFLIIQQSVIFPKLYSIKLRFLFF